VFLLNRFAEKLQNLGFIATLGYGQDTNADTLAVV